MEQVKLNTGIAKLLVNLLDFVELNLISKIDLDFAQVAGHSVIGKLKATALLLSDGDLNDKEQLRAIWGHFLADPQIAESVRLALTEAAANIKNQDVKEGVILLINPIVDTIVAVSDENTNNSDQLEQIWLDFTKSAEFIAFIEKHVETIVHKLIKNETWADLLVNLLKMFIK